MTKRTMNIHDTIDNLVLAKRLVANVLEFSEEYDLFFDHEDTLLGFLKVTN